MKNGLWNFRMYLRLLWVQIRSQMSFRAQFFLDIFSTGLTNGIYFLSLALILQRFDQIGGWRLAEIAFLYGMVEMSFGLMDMIFSGFDPDDFAVVVREGRFDQLMLRPVSLTWQVLGSRFIIRRLGRIMQGLVVWIYALSLLNIHWTAGKILYLPVVIGSQVLMMGSLFMMGSVITFWTLQSVEAVNILTYGGTDMMAYPMHIYSVGMLRFFTYVVPFLFLNYAPALYFLDKPDPLGLPLAAPFLAPVVAGVFFLLALRFWRFGIDHYQSTGS